MFWPPEQWLCLKSAEHSKQWQVSYMTVTITVTSTRQSEQMQLISINMLLDLFVLK